VAFPGFVFAGGNFAGAACGFNELRVEMGRFGVILVSDSGHFAGGLEEQKAAVGAFELLVDAGLLDEEILEILTAAVELAPGLGGAGEGVGFGGRGFADELGFEGPGAALFPEGDGDFFDGGGFEGGGGLVFSEEGVEEVLEALLAFAGEEDGVGGEAEFEGVEGGDGTAGGGDGSTGAGAVAAGGGDLSRGAADF